MFIGHFGVGLGAKKAAPSVSLGTLFLASQFLDLLWPTFILLGWEHVKIEPGITKMTPLNFTDYPLSHSLLMAVVWGILFGAIYFLIKRNYRGALIVGLCVVSHWILDLLVHIPDLATLPRKFILCRIRPLEYKTCCHHFRDLYFYHWHRFLSADHKSQK